MIESYFTILPLNSGNKKNIQMCISCSQSMHNFMFSKWKFVNFSGSTFWDGFQCDDALLNILPGLSICVLLQPTMAFCKVQVGMWRPQERHCFSEGSLLSVTMQYFDWRWSLLFRWMSLSFTLIVFKDLLRLCAHCWAFRPFALKCPRQLKCQVQEATFHWLPVQSLCIYREIPSETYSEEQPSFDTVTFLLEEGASLHGCGTWWLGHLITKAGSLPR